MKIAPTMGIASQKFLENTLTHCISTIQQVKEMMSISLI
ncbi:hypothetical protein ADICYQ_0303 [Cyclobacterium qasimii M12-11B]|uniref:Uncharacterized protein n=1 Tax=Cyclobacterium qasimii M12-11B TaxID=641524 RepID=S7WXI6_9BACT|nr:hypothetical protein ADICYQ_0303 [Cyclobacterium qasimii M12-11B]